MKTDIFIQAIRNRRNLQFLYGLQEVNLEPYYITKNIFGRKVIYGRLRSTNEIRKFEYNRIANNGMELLDLIKQDYPSLPVIIVTGYATVDAAVEAMKKGAADFVSKPFHADELIVKIKKALNLARVLDENRYLRQELHGVSTFPNIIGSSTAIRKILDTLERLKDSECRVLVTGESGTGKEVISRAIHRISPRRDEKFFAVNCAALTETLLESELFGHEKGAFTGAIATKIGLFELAERAT